jgi:hypothetical protein
MSRADHGHLRDGFSCHQVASDEPVPGHALLTQAKNNVSALELKRHLGVRYKAAWLTKHKMLQVM